MSAEESVNGAELIAAERERQYAVEGYDISHDDEHGEGELAWAAASYAIPAAPGPIFEEERPAFQREDGCPTTWPWEPYDWKPTPDDRVRELVKAGALIAAEIDRLQRAAARPLMTGDWFIYDPDPIPEWYPAGGPILVGPFDTEDDAETYANQVHPEDMSGNAVVLRAVAP